MVFYALSIISIIGAIGEFTCSPKGRHVLIQDCHS